MKLRIDGQEFRFRISKEELESLCSGKNIKQQIYLPDGKILAIAIAINDANGMSITHTEAAITLHLGKKIAADFHQTLPAREGIEARQKIGDSQQLKLVLEVDIRSQKRKRT